MKIYVAPMSGITDYSFRKIMKKFNPDLYLQKWLMLIY